MADTLPSETVTPEAPSNETGTVTAPIVDNSNADVEAAKKEAEQARMRANQLENELKKVREAEEAAKQKQLEEKEEFKTLYEQTNARLAEIEAEKAAAEQKAALETATQEVFKDYPANVVEIAKATGLSLNSDDEASAQLLKEKLDVIKTQVGPSTPSANNPNAPAPAAATNEELIQRMRGGDKTAVNEFIRELPAIKRMKEIAQNGA